MPHFYPHAHFRDGKAEGYPSRSIVFSHLVCRKLFGKDDPAMTDERAAIILSLTDWPSEYFVRYYPPYQDVVVLLDPPRAGMTQREVDTWVEDHRRRFIVCPHCGEGFHRASEE